MNVLEQLVLGGQCVARTLRESGRWSLWRPWVPPFAAYAALVLLLAFATHPLLSWALAPLVRDLAGDGALRYPGLFLRLPLVLDRCAIALDAVVLPLAIGVSTSRFAEVFRGARADRASSWRIARSRWLSLVLVNLPVFLVAVGVQVLIAQLPTIRMTALSRAMVPPLGTLAVYLVRAACFWLAPLVVLEGRSAWQAFAALKNTITQAFLPAATALGVLALLQWPARLLADRAGLFVDRGMPELVVPVVLGWVAVHMLVSGLAAGVATLLYLVALAPREDES